MRFVFILLWIGLGEEPGWRGFALPRLLAGRTALAAALILGIIHLVWHLPLFGVEYDAANILPWGITVVCFSIVIAWVWLATGGSVLMADAHARLQQHHRLRLAACSRAATSSASGGSGAPSGSPPPPSSSPPPARRH